MKSVGARALLAALGIACLFLGRVALLAWMVLVAAATAGELFRFARTRGVRPSSLIGLAGIVGLLLLASARGERAPQLFPAIVAATFGASFVEHIVRHRPDATRGLAATVSPVLAVGVLGAYVLALRATRQGFRLALALALVWAGAELGLVLYGRLRATAQTSRSAAEQTLSAIAGALVASIPVAVALNPPFTWARTLMVASLGGLATGAGHRIGEMLQEDTTPAGFTLRLVPMVDGLFLAAPVFFYVFRVVGR